MLELNQVYQGDCLEIMSSIDDVSIDMILADLPYNTTACKWDKIIPLKPLWKQYKRIIKDNGAIVLTCRQPFTSLLVQSNIKNYRQSWIWDKVIGVNFMNAKKQHVQGFEEIVVFYKKQPTYNPQMEEGKSFKDNRESKHRTPVESLGSRANYKKQNNKGERYPRGIIRFSARNNSPIHPTQKPVALFEYFIKTYTDEGDLVLDNVAGSGTTGVACQNLNRNYILIEKELEYVEMCRKRLGNKQASLSI